MTLKEKNLMPYFTWNDSYSVGVARFDEQHRQLFEITNRLNNALAMGMSRDTMREIFEELSNYARTHFVDEQKMMEETEYPERFIHMEEHRKITRELNDFKIKSEANSFVMGMEIMFFLRGWLERHILEVDKKYGTFFNEKGYQ